MFVITLTVIDCFWIKSTRDSFLLLKVLLGKHQQTESRSYFHNHKITYKKASFKRIKDYGTLFIITKGYLSPTSAASFNVLTQPSTAQIITELENKCSITRKLKQVLLLLSPQLTKRLQKLPSHSTKLQKLVYRTS